jgi:hypothetical protein
MTTQIFVWLVGREDIRLSVPVLHIPKGRDFGEGPTPRVKWISHEAGISFEIDFKSMSPFDGGHFETNGPPAELSPTARASTIYYYNIVAKDAKGHVIARLDPAVVIDEPPN